MSERLIARDDGVTVEETNEGERTWYTVRRDGKLVAALPDRARALRFAFQRPFRLGPLAPNDGN
jgi:hypothetical protein